MMERLNTPDSNRKHIAFFGRRNAGKSSIFNLLLNQEISLVSDVPGTTTDPVYKSMELIGYGPVRIIDTAGLDDVGSLGRMRVEKTEEILQKTDLAIYVLNAGKIDKEEKKEAKLFFQRFRIPYVFVWNKLDQLKEEERKKLRKENSGDSFLDENIKPWILPQELILEKNKDEFSKRYSDLNKIYNYDFENGKETLNGIPSNSSISYKTKENNFIFIGTNNYIKIPKIFLNSSEKIKFKVKILDAWFKEQGENFVEFKIPTTSNPLLDDDIRLIRNQNIQFGENGTIGLWRK